MRVHVRSQTSTSTDSLHFIYPGHAYGVSACRWSRSSCGTTTECVCKRQMGKDKAKPAAPEPTPAAATGKPPKGHRQRGAGTVITAKPPVVTGDGVVLKAHERLPSQLLHEYCQGQKRPTPSYFANPPGNRFRVVLRDGKNDKNDLTFATPQAFETSSMARDFAALLALFHVQRNFPLERRLPEPYASTWLSMIASEKGQSKVDSKPAKGAVSAAPANKETAAKETADPPLPPPCVGAVSTTTVSGKGSNTNLAAQVVVVLNRDTADWLCDSCGNQNFSKLASGVQRVRCFRCQTPKSDSCQLVASTASATAAVPTTAATGTTAGGKVVVLRSQAAAAPVDLLTGSKATNPVTRAEEERALQEKRAASRRKQLYFDALRRANRPHIVHIPAGLRSKMERLLGITGGANCGESSDTLSLEEVLQTYKESGLFAPDMCNISTAQQAAILERVSAKLIAEGFAEQYVASSLHEVLLQSASDVLDDAFDAAEGAGNSNASLVDCFEKLLTELLLKHLCMSVDEGQLPDAYNPKRFENNKKLSVVSHSTTPASHNTSTKAAPTAKETAPVPADSVAFNCAMATVAVHSLLEDTGAPQSQLTEALLALIVLQEASLWTGAEEASPVLTTLRERLASKAPSLSSGSVDDQPFLDELESLQAIFEGAMQHRKAEDGDCWYHEVTLHVSVGHLRGKGGRNKGAHGGVFGNATELCLRILVHNVVSYPEHAPPIFVTAAGDDIVSGATAARLRQLEYQLRTKANELLGEGMVFQLHSYLQECVDSIDADAVTDSDTTVSAVMQVCGYLSGMEGPAADVPVTAQAGTKLDTHGSSAPVADDSSVATTHLTEATEGTSHTAGTSATTTGRSNNRNAPRKGPGLQSFWTPLPTTTPTPAKVLNTPQAAEMAKVRRQLPAYSKREEVLQLLTAHRAVVVTGETGCGKTTQVPQYLYEQNCQQKILICQPRRLAAVGVATRVAEEVGCALGEQVQ
jgi:hypothetical protein